MCQFSYKSSLLALAIGSVAGYCGLTSAATPPQLREAKSSVLTPSCEGLSLLLTASNTVINSVAWVEKGKSKQVIATVRRAGNHGGWGATRTRPLCPYPSVATYDGKGDAESTKSFACEVPQSM